MITKYFEDDHEMIIVVHVLGNIQFQKHRFLVNKNSMTFEVEVSE